MQVLNTFCVLINLNNLIDALGSRLCHLSHFVAIFSSFAGQMPHYLQPRLQFNAGEFENFIAMEFENFTVQTVFPCFDFS